MSVRHETYLIYGLELDRDKFAKQQDSGDESLEDLNFPYMGDGAKGTIGVLVDGMGGDYAVVGKCLAVENDEGTEYFGFLNLNEILANVSLLEDEIRKWIYEKRIGEFVSGSSSKAFLISYYH